MPARPIPWLPPAPTGAVERILTGLVEEWSRDWIAGSPGCVTIAQARPGELSQWYGSPGAALALADGASVELGREIAGGEGDSDNARDRAILAGLGEAAGADLAARLLRAGGWSSAGDAIAAAGPAPDSAFYRITGSRWSVVVALDAEAGVILRKRAVGSRRELTPGSLAAALAPTEARLGCHVGRVELSAGEVASLARGDLVVLDRGTGDALPLTVEGTVASKGKAAIALEAGALAVRITEAIDLSTGSH